MELVINPFVQNLVIPVVRYITKYDLSHTMEEEVYGFDVDTVRHVNVYVTKELREYVFKLSPHARMMLLAMQYFLIMNKDYLVLSYEKYCELHGGEFSHKRFLTTVRELIKHSVLARKDKTKDEYWYNPRLLCAGKRPSMFPANVMVVKTDKHLPTKIETRG